MTTAEALALARAVDYSQPDAAEHVADLLMDRERQLAAIRSVAQEVRAWLDDLTYAIPAHSPIRRLLDALGPEAQAQRQHKWKWEKITTDYGTGVEHVRVCDECGYEDPGEDSPILPCPPSDAEAQARPDLPAEGQVVFVHGGVAQYRGGVFYTGMEDPRYERPIQWPVTWWAPTIPVAEGEK